MKIKPTMKKANESKDFSGLVGDVESLPINKWKYHYPHFYAWLQKNGFIHNQKFDEGQIKKTAEQNTASEIYDFIYFNGIICSMSLQQMMDAFEKEFNIKKKHDFSREPTEEERNKAIEDLKNKEAKK